MLACNAFAPTRTVAPSGSLMSLEGAKEHLRVLDEDSDDLIEGLVAAVSAHLDGYHGILGQALLTQTWTMKLPRLSGSAIRLPLGPLIGTLSIAYYDASNASQTFTAFKVASDAIGPVVILDDGASWPSTYSRADAATITWQCGYGASADDVPASIIHAAKLLLGHWFDNRAGVITGTIASELPLAVEALLMPHRRFML